MRKISALVLTAMLSVVGLAAPSFADKVEQFCVDFEDTGTFYAHLADDYKSWEQMRGHKITVFVNTPGACADLEDGAGYVWDGDNPFPEPVTEVPCEVVTIIKTVKVPVEVEVVRTVEVPVEVTSVQTVTDPALVSKVKRQRALIKKLRAKLRNK